MGGGRRFSPTCYSPGFRRLFHVSQTLPHLPSTSVCTCMHGRVRVCAWGRPAWALQRQCLLPLLASYSPPPSLHVRIAPPPCVQVLKSEAAQPRPEQLAHRDPAGLYSQDKPFWAQVTDARWAGGDAGVDAQGACVCVCVCVCWGGCTVCVCGVTDHGCTGGGCVCVLG